MQKLIARVGFTRHVVNQFEEEVNALLDRGWTLVHFGVEKGIFRIFCNALLSDPAQSRSTPPILPTGGSVELYQHQKEQMS